MVSVSLLFRLFILLFIFLFIFLFVLLFVLVLFFFFLALLLLRVLIPQRAVGTHLAFFQVCFTAFLFCLRTVTHDLPPKQGKSHTSTAMAGVVTAGSKKILFAYGLQKTQNLLFIYLFHPPSLAAESQAVQLGI